VGRDIVPKVGDEDKVLLNLVKVIMPAEGYMLLLVVLVSVVMSSLDSLLNAGAVAFVEDVVKPFAELPDKTALKIGRYATIVIAAIAAGGAVFIPSIIAGLLICYTIWASAILPALIIGLWAKRPRPLAAIMSMSVGILVAMIAIIFLIRFPKEIEVIIIPSLAVAVLAYALGHWIEGIIRGA
jgi:SSS family solute:Na+ symporter